MNRKELTEDFMRAQITSAMKRRSSKLLNTIPELATKDQVFVYLNAMYFDNVADDILESLDYYMSLFSESVNDYYKQLKEKGGE